AAGGAAARDARAGRVEHVAELVEARAEDGRGRDGVGGRLAEVAPDGEVVVAVAGDGGLYLRVGRGADGAVGGAEQHLEAEHRVDDERTVRELGGHDDVEPAVPAAQLERSLAAAVERERVAVEERAEVVTALVEARPLGAVEREADGEVS